MQQLQKARFVTDGSRYSKICQLRPLLAFGKPEVCNEVHKLIQPTIIGRYVLHGVKPFQTFSETFLYGHFHPERVRYLASVSSMLTLSPLLLTLWLVHERASSLCGMLGLTFQPRH